MNFQKTSSRFVNTFDGLSNKGLRVFISGRRYTVEKFEMGIRIKQSQHPTNFDYNSKNGIHNDKIGKKEEKANINRTKNLRTLKLDDLTDGQVDGYINAYYEQNREVEQNGTKIRELAPSTGIFPELSYRNPLVLRVLLKYISKHETGALTSYEILSGMTRDIFEWYLEKLPRKEGQNMSERVTRKGEIIKELSMVHCEFARNLVLDKITNTRDTVLEKISEQNDFKYKDIIKRFIVEDKNVGFIHSLLTSEADSEGYQFVPNRIQDFFMLQDIINLLLKKDKESLEMSLMVMSKVAKNMQKYRNFIELLTVSFKDEISTENNTVNLIKYIFENMPKNKFEFYKFEKEHSKLIANIANWDFQF